MKPAQLYRRLAELPTYVAASFLGPNGTHLRRISVTPNRSPLALRVVTSVRDHSNNRKRTIIKTIVFPLGEGGPIITSQEQAESVIASTVSRSGTRIAILKESKEADKVKRQVEIWRGSTAEVILDVTKEHGEFYGDGAQSLSICSPRPSDNVDQILSRPSLFPLPKVRYSTRPKRTHQRMHLTIHSENTDSSRPLEKGSLVANDPRSFWLNGAILEELFILRPSVQTVRMS